MTIRADVHFDYLEGKSLNIYSQFGEDGLLQAVFDRIGTRNKWCFEIGAHDGKTDSNTLALREQDWRAVLIERNPGLMERLDRYQSDKVDIIYETCTDLDRTLFKTPIPTDPDLGVIDIDGQDYWLWYDMVRYRPRVLLIEWNPYEKGREYVPHRGGTGQATRMPLVDLGNERGYTLVATTYCNLLFVRTEEHDGTNVSDAKKDTASRSHS